MVDDYPNILLDSDLDSDLTENHHLANTDRAEFLGTFEQDGKVCDYYLVSDQSKTYYCYVLRSESRENN